MGIFILANKLAGRSDEGRQRSQEALRVFAGKQLKSAKMLAEPEPPAEVARQVKIFEADPEEVKKKSEELPATVLLEPLKPRFPAWHRRTALTRAFEAALAAAPAGAGTGAQSHGSHVCGIVGARPANAGQYVGLAPGAELFSARVFEDTGGASQGDVANAIDHLAKMNAVHLINLSLGGDSSSIEQDAIRHAEELGTLCVCAAGNDGGRVSYPAAYPECVAVSALGLSGWGPPESLAAAVMPVQPDRYGKENLFLADFSNFGKQINTAAPGVGIISTVPERFGLDAPFAMMNGTSMASPAACGRLAALLAQVKKYTDADANADRVELARSVLDKNCRDIGLDAKYQGKGVLG